MERACCQLLPHHLAGRQQGARFWTWRRGRAELKAEFCTQITTLT